MNLKVGKSGGKTYLSIVHGYRDRQTHIVKTKTIKSLGYLDDLQKQYDDPIAHFKAVVEKMNQEEAEKKPLSMIQVDRKELLAKDTRSRKNFGYTALSQIYHELDIHVFISNRFRKYNVTYNPNSVMKLLAYSRILSPGSKKKAYDNREIYFEDMDFSLDDVYRSLSYFNKLNDDIQLHLHRKITEQYHRSTDLVYYDITNYYFEIDEQDELRKKGVCKEHRPDPIIQMGLFMDTMGIPISYGLFPGNTNDCETLRPILAKMKRDYGIGRTIVVANRELNTSNNILFNLLNHDGYVYSQTIRGGSKEFKDYVFNEKGYRWLSDEYKIKSRVYPRTVNVRTANGGTKKVPIDEKQVVFYSSAYDKKAKAEREPVLMKARALVNSPSKYNSATAYDAAKYVKDLVYDKTTGEILTTGHTPTIDEAKLREEERFDGYYAIVTSEYKKTDEEIIEIYRGLWKIEETFKVTKSDLETRPVYLSRKDHIEAHFLICFIALVITRILELRLGNQFSVSQIIDSLKNVSCSYLEENIYLFDYRDEITDAVCESLGVDLNHKYLSLGEIKNIIGATKKG